MKNIIVTLIAIFLITICYADTIIVDWNGGGDYTTIQAGINAATAGDTVQVKYGTYTETVTINKNITLTKYATQSPTITSSGNSTIYITNYYGANVSGFNIENTAQNGYGIYKLSGTSIIDDCIISGMDIGIKVVNNNLAHIELFDCQIYNNETGILITSDVDESETTSIISKCNIYQNSIGIKHYPYSAYDLQVEDCTIHDNTSKGISINGGDEITITNCLIYDNINGNSGFGIYDIAGYCDIINCTIYGNYNGISFAYGQDQDIINSILWGNSYADIVGSPTVTYSCIEDGYTGTGNIDEDPLFYDAPHGDFSLRWDRAVFSPCIDTGDPDEDYEDADGTPADMGAIPAVTHDYFRDDYDGYSYDNIDWISFPVLNRTTTNWMNAIDVLKRQYLIDDDYLTEDSLDYVLYDNVQKIYYYANTWQNDLGNFDSMQGYKFVLRDSCDYVPSQGISGTWLDPGTAVTLYPNQENWVGCFLEGPILLLDALESIEDEWVTVASEHWYLSRGGFFPWNWTVNPGELYIITVDTLCQLVWNESCSKGVDAYVKEKTEYFTYTETVDYMAIEVDTVSSENPVTEIAVYYDGECLGATKVYDDEYPVQILAYTPEETKIGNNELEFMIYCGGYKNTDTQVFSSKPLFYKQKSSATVQLTAKEIPTINTLTLLQNYPNPVKANMTTISFMPEQDAKHTELNIYNIRGQLVQTIDCDGIISSGTKDVYYSISWDCKDRHGKDVKNCIYFYKLTSGNKSALHKMLLMK